MKDDFVHVSAVNVQNIHVISKRYTQWQFCIRGFENISPKTKTWPEVTKIQHGHSNTYQWGTVPLVYIL